MLNTKGVLTIAAALIVLPTAAMAQSSYSPTPSTQVEGQSAAMMYSVPASTSSQSTYGGVYGPIFSPGS